MTNGALEPLENVEIPDIRITDEVIKRMVFAEQRRIGDPNATKTAGRIIERYFAMTNGGNRQPQPSPTP